MDNTPDLNLIDIRTLAQLQNEFDKVYLLEDRQVIKTVAAFVIANRTARDPLWLFLVAPSSGGKTEIINAIEGLTKFVHPIDTLTVNTFASGQKRAGKETSLLLKIQSGILTFKDFTSILEMNKDARKEIMSQLRAIFDGKYVKRTGTGDDITWNGKLGLIAAVTSIIHHKQQEFAAMGERFIQYSIKQPDRKEVQRRIFSNSFDIGQKRTHLQLCFKSYIENVLNAMQDVDVKFSAAVTDELIELADFSTMARSGLAVSERDGSIQFIPDSEMPTRVTSQLITLASGLISLQRGEPGYVQPATGDELSADDREIIHKITLDSVPRKRRQALQFLTKYRLGATAAAVATELNYETEVMKQTLQELCALQLAKRVARRDTYFYVLNPLYRPTLEKFENISPLDEELQATNANEEDTTDANKAVDEAFDLI